MANNQLATSVQDLIRDISNLVQVKNAATTDLDPGSAHPSDMPKEEGGQRDASTGSYYSEMTADTKDNHSGANLVEDTPDDTGNTDAEIAHHDGAPTGADPASEKPPMSDKPTDIEPGTEHSADVEKLAIEDLLKLAAASEADLHAALQGGDSETAAAAQAGYKVASEDDQRALQASASTNVVVDVVKNAQERADIVAHNLVDYINHNYRRKQAEEMPPEGEMLPPEDPAAAAGGEGLPPEAAMVDPAAAGGGLPPEAMGGGDPAAGGAPLEGGGEVSEQELIQSLLDELAAAGISVEDLLAASQGSPDEEAVKEAAEKCNSMLKSGSYRPQSVRTPRQRELRKLANQIITELIQHSRR